MKSISQNCDNLDTLYHKTTYKNPILEGFYPDPSICRVGSDYYMVTSSFAYYPGLPIFHSTNLVDWTQIGHGIHRVDQLDYKNCETSLGLWAPTLRYHDGTFYIINTFVSEGREARRDNYIITAKSPEGPWSDPIFIEGADGIDPSLFFDSDGKIYYTGNYINDNPKYQGHHGIYLQELDPKTFQFISPRKIIWDGLKTRSKWIEAPHLFKISGYYYLLVAEGGTFEDHSVMISRCKTIDGDYEICPRNPIVSHRHLPLTSPISVVGHGDLVQTQHGEWWMVLLGVRPYNDFNYNLGRETFLVPIVWDHNGWPRIDNPSGIVREMERRPDLPDAYRPPISPCDHFENTQLNMYWNFIHPPVEPFYSLSDHPGHLRIYLKKEEISTISSPAFIGRRQQHHSFMATTKMTFYPHSMEKAGLVLIQDDCFNLSLLISQKGNKTYVLVIKRDKGQDKILIEKEITPRDHYFLSVNGRSDSYQFYYGEKEHRLEPIGPSIDASILSSTSNEGFTGTYIGLYGSSCGKESTNYVDFEWFNYYNL